MCVRCGRRILKFALLYRKFARRLARWWTSSCILSRTRTTGRTWWALLTRGGGVQREWLRRSGVDDREFNQFTQSVALQNTLHRPNLILEPRPRYEFLKRNANRYCRWGQAREQRGRESIIAQQTVRLVREQVAQCYKTEGVNHYKNCQEVTQKYYDLITAPGFGILSPN